VFSVLSAEDIKRSLVYLRRALPLNIRRRKGCFFIGRPIDGRMPVIVNQSDFCRCFAGSRFYDSSQWVCDGRDNSHVAYRKGRAPLRDCTKCYHSLSMLPHFNRHRKDVSPPHKRERERKMSVRNESREEFSRRVSSYKAVKPDCNADNITLHTSKQPKAGNQVNEPSIMIPQFEEEII